MRHAVHAEWTKLRTTPGTFWLLASVIIITTAVGALSAAAATCCALDAAKTSLTGILLGQAVVAIVAVLFIGNEYNTGTIHLTLASVPNRSAVLAAKTLILATVVAVTSGISALASVLAGTLFLPTLSLTDRAVQRATFGSMLYLVLIALLSLGLATIVRNPGPAIGIVLGLLYVFPILSQTASDPAWERRLHQIGPMTAGLSIQATTGLPDLPLSPWTGLGVLALWSTSALLLAALLLHHRDA
jgi:ABC-2 type transport system permease protein